MSGGRPVQPEYTPFTWDTNNYASGSDPWAATPKQVAPGNAFFTPGVVAPAQHVNSVVGTLADQDLSGLDQDVAMAAWVGQVPDLSFPVRSTGRIAAFNGVFNHKEGTHYIINSGAANSIEATYDGGHNWSTPTFSGSTAYLDAGVDNSGHMVFIPSSNNIQNGTYSSGSVTFTLVSGPFTGTPSGSQVVYNTDDSLWCVCFRNSTSGLRAYTSSNRTTWTDRTSALPASLTGYTGTNNPVMQTNGARCIILLETAAGMLDGAYSDDGGVTWTALVISVGTTKGAPTRPVYSAEALNNSGLWVSSLVDGSAVGWIMYSTDNALTWSTLQWPGSPEEVVKDLTAIGSLITALTSPRNRLFFSIDGQEWHFAGISPSLSSTLRMFGGDRMGGNACLDGTGGIVLLSNRLGSNGVVF